MAWKQSSWYVFHTFTLDYLPEQKIHYHNFFHSFKILLPCEVCISHYRNQLSRPGLTLQENNNDESLFSWTVRIHNNVNSSNQKRVWAIDEARSYYEKEKSNINTNIIKTMVLEYVRNNFKKGPIKTEELFVMLNSMRYIYPEEEKRKKLISMKTILNRNNIREWLLEFLKIICEV